MMLPIPVDAIGPRMTPRDLRHVSVGWIPRSVNQRVASYRYRVEFPISALREQGIPAEIFSAEKPGFYSHLVFSKRFSANDVKFVESLRRIGVKTYLDLCDNYFYHEGNQTKKNRTTNALKKMLNQVDHIICSTPYLADIVREHSDSEEKPIIINDIVEDIALDKTSIRNKKRSLLWFGQHGSPNAQSGMLDILNIIDIIIEMSLKYDFEIVFCSNSRHKYESSIAPLPLNTRYVEWNQTDFSRELGNSLAVLLPLSDNPYVKAKTHNRLSLCLYAGVPVIASEIPSYIDFEPFCWLNKWREGLETVLSNPSLASAKARPARKFIDAYYGINQIKSDWISSFVK